MYLFYVFALVPVVLSLILYLFTKRIVRVELMICAGAALFVAAIMNLISYGGMTADTEIWSGNLESVTHYPQWTEEYRQRHTRQNSKGETISTWYTTEHRTHHEYFEGFASYGKDCDTIRINSQDYFKYSALFGGHVTERPHKSGFDGGDPFIYVSKNKTGVIVPMTKTKSWTNKVKASPSTFSYDKVPDSIKVFSYPKCLNQWTSDRLLGDASGKIDIKEFDKMNTMVGLHKQGNVIIVGFDSADVAMAKYQEAAWLGGKKNDVVICYGYAALEGNVKNVVWTKCFSWCENDQFKRNIEKIFMDNPIDTTILVPLYKEIKQNFVRKDWNKMDYLKVKPSRGYWIGYIITMTVIIWTVLVISYLNDENRR